MTPSLLFVPPAGIPRWRKVLHRNRGRRVLEKTFVSNCLEAAFVF
jgi:hypothetical protein